MENSKHLRHHFLAFKEIAIVSLEYAKRNYDCYCQDCITQLEKAIELEVKFVILFEDHIIGVTL